MKMKPAVIFLLFTGAMIGIYFQSGFPQNQRDEVLPKKHADTPAGTPAQPTPPPAVEHLQPPANEQVDTSGSSVDMSTYSDEGFVRTPQTGTPLPPFHVKDLNFTGLTILVFNMSNVEFNDDIPEHFLTNMFTINNIESAKTVLGQVVEYAKGAQGQGVTSPHGQSFGGGQAGTGSQQQRYNLNFVPGNPDGGMTVRPSRQRQGLAKPNCINNYKFRYFSHKHIIRIGGPLDPDMYGPMAYDRTLGTRLSDAYSFFSFFFVNEDHEMSYEYDDTTDLCEAQESFDTYTCVRMGISDQIVGCFSNGKCYPDYVKKSSHLTQLRCVPGSAVISSDFKVTLEAMEWLQEQFVRGIINMMPPTSHAWQVNAFRNRRRAAARHGIDFDEEEPAEEKDRREEIFDSFKIFCEENGYPIPDRVLRLFYNAPSFYFAPGEGGMRWIPNRPDCGFVRGHAMNYEMCPTWVQPNYNGFPTPEATFGYEHRQVTTPAPPMDYLPTNPTPNLAWRPNPLFGFAESDVDIDPEVAIALFNWLMEASRLEGTTVME